MGFQLRTIEWCADRIRIIDQTVLPHQLVHLEILEVAELVLAIQRLEVRGAPALGVAGALGVALAARREMERSGSIERVREAAEQIAHARPTAINLRWGVERALAEILGMQDLTATAEHLSRFAGLMVEEDIRINETLSNRGADLIEQLCNLPVSIQTHCNAGGLACVEWGTALGVVRALHERGHLTKVYASETRPLLQGARLTAFELEQMGIAHQIVVDGAASSVIASGLVGAVVVGADRIAANGDVANKIGTYPLALASARAEIPFVVAAPESTIDRRTLTGADIEIELRDEREILEWHGTRVAPISSSAYNPAFDVTPADLVTAIVTERRVIRSQRGQRP